MALFASAGVASTGQSFSQTLPVFSNAGKAKPKPAVLRVSVPYPSNGIISTGQPQMVQVAFTVEPPPGTPLSTYQLLLEMRSKKKGRVMLAQYIPLSQANSVTTLNVQSLAAGEYNLTAELQADGKPASSLKRQPIKKKADPVATPTLTATATPAATDTATP